MESSPATSNNGKRFSSRKGVRVVGKIRGFTESERHSHANVPQIFMSREDDHVSVTLHGQANGRRDTYILDGLYEHDESTSEIFAHEVNPLLQGLIHGDNCCVIASGAQGSGKSQLIQGSEETPGLAMMAFCEIFSSIEKVGGSIAISCYEMRNDRIYDLLEYKEQEIQIMENAEKEIWLKGLSKIPVKSISDFVNFYFHVRNSRKFPQNMEIDGRINSHIGLIMYIITVDKESKNSVVGKIKFMDLAGYEDVRNRVDAKAYKSECSKVNKSLYALHNVVTALNGDEPYIPYREAKLTRLLQDFLCNMNNSILITCLSPTLCPLTLRAISMASRSCQFVNRQRHDFARSIKKISSTYKGNTLDNTMIKQGICRVGSSRTKVKGNSSTHKGSAFHTPMLKRGICGVGSNGINTKENSSTSEGRLQSHVSTVMKATPSPHMTKERKFFNAAHPLSNTQKLTNQHNKEKENSPIDRPTKSSITKKDTSESVDQLQNDIDTVLAIDHIQDNIDNALDVTLSVNPEGCSPEHLVSDKHSPTLTETLRELSNRFKSLSSQAISSKFNFNSIHEGVEPKTPTILLSSKVDYNLVPESFATPQDKLKARSTVMKKSLVNECLDFLNNASKEELKNLKWIGEKRANYILELREESPYPFKNIDDLKGLGLSLKQIKGMVSQIMSDA